MRKKSTGNLSNKQLSYCPPTEELSKFVFPCKDQPCIFGIIQSCISVQRSDQTDRTCLQTICFLKQYSPSSSFFIKDIFAFSLLQGSIVFMFCSATALWLYSRASHFTFGLFWTFLVKEGGAKWELIEIELPQRHRDNWQKFKIKKWCQSVIYRSVENIPLWNMPIVRR